MKIINKYWYHFFTAGIKSKRLIKKIKKRNPEYSIVISDGTGIGDLCFSLSYLPDFRSRLNKKILLVLSENLRDIVACFKGYDKLLFFSKKQISDFRYVLNRHIKWKWYEENFANNEVIFTYARYYSIVKNKSEKNILDILLNDIYRLQVHRYFQYPVVPARTVEHLQEGKKILFNLSSNSSEISVETFNKILKFFQDRKYIMYTNCVKDSDVCLFKTNRLQLSIFQLYSISDQFDYVVSVRSGILDFIASKAKKHIVLYEHNNFLPLYTMKQWPGVDALEMYYDDPDLMEKIEEYVEGRNEN